MNNGDIITRGQRLEPQTLTLICPSRTNNGDTIAVIAILDSGFELDHEDLADDIFVWGRDFVGYYDTNPMPYADPSTLCNYFDVTHCWHGTSVMGVVAAMTDNGVGLAGPSWNASTKLKICPLKICGDYWGFITTESVSAALQWARYKIHQSDVITGSFGLAEVSSEIEWNVQRCYDQRIPMFFAAGSCSDVVYPALLPKVMAVGYTDRDDLLGPDSPFSDSLDLVAPGMEIWLFDLTGDGGLNPTLDYCNGDPDYFCHYAGSSYSTPLAAAVAARVLMRRPDLLTGGHTTERIYDVVRLSAEDKGPAGFDPGYGWGRVNADRALLAVTRGDANNSGTIDIDDILYLIGYIFESGAEPQPRFLNGDANCSGDVDIDDVIYLVGYMFSEGPAPIDCFVY